MATLKTSSFAYIFLWTIAMILTLSLSAIGITFMALEDDPALGLLLGAVGLFGFIFSLKKIIAHDLDWKKQLRDEIVSDSENILAQWEYSEKPWNIFVEKQMREKRKTTILLTIVIPSLIFIGAAASVFAEDEPNPNAWTIITSITVSITILTWYICVSTLEAVKRTFLAYQNQRKKPTAIIGKKGIVINNYLFVPFQPFSGELVGIKQTVEHDIPLMLVQIKIRSDQGTSIQASKLLIPKDKEQEAIQVIQELQTVYFPPAPSA